MAQPGVSEFTKETCDLEHTDELFYFRPVVEERRLMAARERIFT
jgi:hypothetical protein